MGTSKEKLVQLPNDKSEDLYDGYLEKRDLQVCRRLTLEMYSVWPASKSFQKMKSLDFSRYQRIIKNPIALEVIRRKLNSGTKDKYDSIGSFIKDVRLMINNCRNFWERDDFGDEYINDAKKLEKHFNRNLKEFRRLIHESNSSDSSPEKKGPKKSKSVNSGDDSRKNEIKKDNRWLKDWLKSEENSDEGNSIKDKKEMKDSKPKIYRSDSERNESKKDDKLESKKDDDESESTQDRKRAKKSRIHQNEPEKDEIKKENKLNLKEDGDKHENSSNEDSEAESERKRPGPKSRTIKKEKHSSSRDGNSTGSETRKDISDKSKEDDNNLSSSENDKEDYQKKRKKRMKKRRDEKYKRDRYDSTDEGEEKSPLKKNDSENSDSSEENRRHRRVGPASKKFKPNDCTIPVDNFFQRNRKVSRDQDLDDEFWIKKLDLKWEDKRVLLNNERLNDTHILAAQKLIKSKYKRTIGLQDPLLAQRSFKYVGEYGDSVQIHYNGDSHWLTSASIGGEIKVFDSLLYKITDYTRKQLDQCYERIQYDMADVQKQDGSHDCGLFAIAFAVGIASGNWNAKAFFDQSLMRTHLQKCLENLEIKPFPIY